MKHRFQELIEELGKCLDMPLHLDKNQTCTILFSEKLEVQIERFGDEDLLIGAFICSLPPGKFRETILLSALRANQSLYPTVGTLGYSETQNKLAIFRLVDMKNLTGDKISEILAYFVPTGLEWKDSIETRNVAPNAKGSSGKGQFPGPFGIKP